MTTLIVDGEKLLGSYLRSHPAIVALDCRIVGKTPSATDTPWARVTMLNAPSVDPVDHHVPFLFQIDCYAGIDGGQPEANLIARTIRAALRVIAESTHTDGVPSGARINGQARIPDSDFEPARERIVITTTVYAHA